jgi:FkbM family methyltransferase
LGLLEVMLSVIKRSASTIHRAAAANRRLAGGYLRLYRLLKHLPDGRWKNYVMNSLQSVDWPIVDLPPARVESGQTAFSLVPHLKEGDFAAHLYRRLEYESEVTGWLSGRRYELVIELGANVGVHTVLYAKLWPEARIYSFEPSRKAYRRLVENLTLNDCKNVTPFNCAISSESGLVDFYEPLDHLTNGSLKRSVAEYFAETVETIKAVALNACDLKQLFSRGGRALIKIDVEGMEPTVIRALAPILTTEGPDVVIEVLDMTAEELNGIDFLRAYRRFQITPGGLVERPQFVPTEHRDYALIPR